MQKVTFGAVIISGFDYEVTKYSHSKSQMKMEEEIVRDVVPNEKAIAIFKLTANLGYLHGGISIVPEEDEVNTYTVSFDSYELFRSIKSIMTALKLKYEFRAAVGNIIIFPTKDVSILKTQRKFYTEGYLDNIVYK